MTSWTQKAKAHFSQERKNNTTETTENLCDFSQERKKHTIETIETPLLMVSMVQSGAFCKKHDVSNQGEAAANDPATSDGQKGCCLGFVASIPDHSQKIECLVGAAIDVTPLPVIRQTEGRQTTERSPYDGTNPKFREASKSLDDLILKHGGALDLPPMPEKMIPKNGELFTARLARFTDKGVTLVDAQTFAIQLQTRDRDLDDRRMCLECRHLNGFGAWQCANWCKAMTAHRPRDNGLPAALVTLLQRCDGFTLEATP